MSKEILVVDDNSDIRLLISSILKDKGFSVRTAANFDQALLEINKKTPDIAVIDVKLDKDKITSKANSEEIEKEYFVNTDSARKNRVFGSPSFMVNHEIFWGDDRMEDAITWSKK